MVARSQPELDRQISLHLAADEIKQPLHNRIRQILREQILKSFQHDQRFYSERELIRKLGVSQPTVRRALSDLIGEGFLKPAKRRGFFVQKEVAVRYVGLMCPAERNSLLSKSVETLSLACRNRNIVMNVYYVHRSEAIEDLFKSIRHRPSEERTILIGLPTEFAMQMGAKLQVNGFTQLSMGPRVPALYGSSLSLDHENEVDQVLDHLTGLGHQRIAFLVNEPKDSVAVNQRAEAISHQLAKRGLTESSLVTCDIGQWPHPFDAAYHQTQKIWEEGGTRPTAIVPLSGLGAWAVERYAHEHKIRVPGELSIVSFDPIANSNIMPIVLTRLTFLHLERANRALDLLWADNPSPRHEMLRANLGVGASSGPAPA